VKVRNVSGQVVVAPVDGGIAVAVDGVVEVAEDVGRVLVVSGQFNQVRATRPKPTARGTAKRAKA
jgi:hypothetical protein